MVTSMCKNEDILGFLCSSFWLLQGKKFTSPLMVTFFQKSKPTDSGKERKELDKDFGRRIKKQCKDKPQLN